MYRREQRGLIVAQEASRREASNAPSTAGSAPNACAPDAAERLPNKQVVFGRHGGQVVVPNWLIRALGLALDGLG